MLSRVKSAGKLVETSEKRGKTCWDEWKARENMQTVIGSEEHECFQLYQADWMPEEKWNDTFLSNWANQELPFFIPFSNSPFKWNLLNRSRTMNLFVKMEQQILVSPVRTIKVDHPQRFSRIFWYWGMNWNGPFHLTSDPKIPESLA